MQKLLSEIEVAELTGLTRSALRQMRYLGNGPVYIRVSSRVIRYAPADVEAFLADRRRRQTGGAEVVA